MKIKTFLLTAFLVLATCVTSHAQFRFNAGITDNSWDSSFLPSAGSNNFMNLLGDVVHGRGAFAHSSTSPIGNYTAQFGFLELDETMLLHVFKEPSLTTLSLDVPSESLFESFNSSESNHTENAFNLLKTFIETDPRMKHFFQGILLDTLTTPDDGTPQSTTAKMSDALTQTIGLTPASELVAEAAGVATPAARTGFSDFGFGINSGQFKLFGVKGTYSDFVIPFTVVIDENITLAISIPLNYLYVEGSSSYGAGINLALPFRIFRMGRDCRFNWKLAPVVGMQARFNTDLDSANAIWTAGVVNAIDFRVNRRLILSFVNQLTFYSSTVINYDDYRTDPAINQQILRNGLRAVTPVNRRLILEVFAFETNFLQDATVDDYTTIGSALSFRLTKKGSITVGANYDFGSHYRSWSVGMKSIWSY